jgi:hypothetical protein
MVFLMVQAVLFGIGVVLVLGTPLAKQAMSLMGAARLFPRRCRG